MLTQQSPRMVSIKTLYHLLPVLLLLASEVIGNGDESEERCNICGCTPGCRFTVEDGTVEFINEQGQNAKSRCGYLQRGIEERGEYSQSLCRTHIWKQAFEPCGCVNRNNNPLIDISGKLMLQNCRFSEH